MATIDLLTIADNLAGRFAPAQLPATPADTRAVTSSTARLPNQVGGDTPKILTFITDGVLSQGPGSHRKGVIKAAVRLYYDLAPMGVLEADLPSVAALTSQLIDQLATDSDLGGTVIIARVVGFTIGSLSYAGETFTGSEVRAELVIDTALTVTP